MQHPTAKSPRVVPRVYVPRTSPDGMDRTLQVLSAEQVTTLDPSELVWGEGEGKWFR